MLEIYHFMIGNDYHQTLACCDKYIQLLEDTTYKNISALSGIHFQKIACCIQLKQYEKGIESINFCLSIQETGSFNWFKTHEIHLSLCFHTQEYQKAWEIYQHTTKHKLFVKLPPNVREPWKIYEAWLYFLIAIGRIHVREDDRKKFKLNRFLNEVPIFSKDKRGLNVPILILQILFQLQQRKFDALIDQIEAISKYHQRYVSKEDNYRSNCFIKMLIEIPKAYFKRNRVIRQTHKWYQKLQSVSIDISNQNHDLEILPYDDVWEFVLELLDERGY